MTPVPLAYKYVAIAVMLAEINYCASRLHLPIDLPVKESDIRVAMVDNPSVHSHLQRRPIEYGFSGRIDTSKYTFSFPAGGGLHPNPGKLRFIIRLDNGYEAYSTTKIQGDLPTREFLPQLVGIHSTIDTNDAYRIATNWLTAIDVDVQWLQKEYPVTVRQQFLTDYGPLPIFDVRWGAGREDKWGHPKSPVVDITIASDTRELLHLRQNDDSYSKRPFVLIKDMDKLLAIPDVEFLKYTSEQRSNLVVRFSAVTYPALTNESRSLLSEPKTLPVTNAPVQP
jgi:hypothetical protein